MRLKAGLLYLLLTISTLCLLAESRPQTLTKPDPSEVARIATMLQNPETRQLGILGFTALGAMMFPILVSLGMASFVSHLPTVFKEFASEFGIPATPPRNFFMFRKLFNQRSAYDSRWDYVLDNFQRRLGQSPDGDYLKFAYGR